MNAPRIHEMTTAEKAAILVSRVPEPTFHSEIKSDLLRYTVAMVGDAMGWGSAVLDFRYVRLPHPIIFALVGDMDVSERSIVAMWEDSRDIVIRARHFDGKAESVCERRIVEPAWRTFRGDYGELARQDAQARFRRLRDIDFAEKLGPRP